ncbi:N-acetylglucosamine-specific PTS transporter subunit IIBC [Liquorilactobacillus oeni]|uniref:N-acetylglucosamine PTS, EIICBA n=1 Tax=Liquorilactobacillus oeni DSM 19972 TaxID=1423777 RepID=A0A0R1MMH7_9LACO|nr:N-acetylglucosamine-specific PTS transporter subunit IIBC [Liquorilactobacillus oeni]KRL05787.1 N-acetylglucosamine PTS, EIICBA [Liquorilactobacillus oeni DSM 19972]
MKTYLQRMGRSIQLPISVLPAAALLVGIGHWLPSDWAAAKFLQDGGNAVLGILALLFAAGLSTGMSKNKDGAAALAGVVAYFIPVSVLAPASVAALEGTKTGSVDPAFSAIAGNVFIGILSGLIAAALYNRFYKTKLPMALSFFSGKRLVPIMAAAVMLLVSLVLLFVWPVVYGWLVAFGKFIVSLGAVGAGLYGFFNRLLIPTGLHQALNSVFWFNVAGINDLGKFWANQGTKGVTGMYMAGFFPIMMFGLPAGAYAIYKNARPERKKVTASLMMAGAFASFFTGVTEPLEFSFMFVAWPLYVIHAIFTGLSVGFAAFMHWTAGFTFSAGLVDFVLSSRMPMASKPYMLIVQGIVMAFIYYFGFDFAIKKFNLMTPGRESLVETQAAVAAEVPVDEADDRFTLLAKKIYAAIGGYQNIKVVDNCTTRLRLQLNDTARINKAALSASGVPGVNVLDKHNLQVIVGTEVQFVAAPLEQLFKNKAAISTVPVSMTAKEDPSKKTSTTGTDEIFNVAEGNYLRIEEVADKTFASKVLGDGYAVEPTSGQIFSPADGKVSAVFPTKHAVGITTELGLELLVHIGINTVELKGRPFEVVVSKGQEVKHGDLLVKADLAKIKAAGKKATTMVIATNMDRVAHIDKIAQEGKVSVNKLIMKVITK